MAATSINSLAARLLATALLLLALSACDFLMSSDARAQRAREHMSAGDYQRAARELKSILEDDPEHAQSRLLLAQLQLQLGDTQGAAKELDRAAAAGADSQTTQEVRYALLIAQRKWDDVLASLSKDKLTPQHERQILEAQARIGLTQYAEAEKLLAEAAAHDPQDSRLLLQQLRLCAATNRAEEALALAERIKEPAAVRAQALRTAATILMSRGSYEPARQMLAEALTLAQKHSTVPEQLMIAVGLTEANLTLQDMAAAQRSLGFIEQRAGGSFPVHYYRARIALQKNEYTTAVAECQRALSIDPDNVPTNLMLAAAHIAHGSLAQGEEVLQKVLANDSRNAAARKLLAQVYLSRGRPDDARRLLAPEGVGSQDDAQIDWLMGLALTQSGEAASGLEHLERSLAGAAPDDSRRLDLAAAYLGAGAPDKAGEVLAGLPKSIAESNRAAALALTAAVAGKSPAAAQKEVERLLAVSGQDVRMLSAAGAYYMGVGDLERSNAVLTRAAQLDARALNARMMLAVLAARRLEWSAAAQRIDEVLAINADYEPAFLLRAEIALSRGQPAEARRTLEQAIGRNPAALEPRLRLARLAFADNDPARGRDLLKQAATLFGGRPEVRNAVGSVLEQAGLQEEALAHFVAAGAAGLPEGMLNVARVHLQLNRLEQASESAQAALRLRPGWPAAQRVIIEVDVRRGQIDRALASAREFAQGASPDVLQEIEGDVYWSAKRFQQAFAAYDRAQQARPSAARALKIFNARRALQLEPTDASLVAWLERHPDDVAVRRTLAVHYESLNRSSEAISQYERVLKQSPNDPVMLNNLAWQLHLKGDPRARELARRAYELSSYVPAISDTYGWLLVQSGEAQRGLEVLEGALAGAPTNPDIRYHVAAARSKSGNRSSAVQMLDELLKESAAFASRADAEKLLQTLRGEGA